MRAGFGRMWRAYARDAAWKAAVEVFLCVRVVASMVAILGKSSFPGQEPIDAGGYTKPIYPKLMEITFGVWERADALWYFHIARDGYVPGTYDSVFFPAYPLLVRAVHSITMLPWVVSGIVVSNLAFFLALGLLYRLVRIETDEATARRTLWYLAFFPGSLFFLAPYTESLFLLLAIAAFLAARTRRWAWAGVAVALLGTVRNFGVLVSIPVALEFIRQYRLGRSAAAGSSGGRMRLASFAWLLMCPLGVLAYMAFWGLKTGDMLTFVHQQSGGWGRQFRLPWDTVWGGVQQAWDYCVNYPGGIYVFEALVTLVVIALGLVAFVRIPASLAVYIWISLLPALVYPYPGRMLMSCIRFSAVLFPVFFTLATLVKRESLDRVVRVSLAALYAIAVALYAANHNMF